MSQVWAYDLDGVLAASPPPSPIKWGKMNGQQRKDSKDALLYHYSQAAVLHRPQGRFHVITARKEQPDVRSVTEQWLHEQFPGQVMSLLMLNKPRRVDVVVPFKAEALRFTWATDFMEDNPAVVRGLRTSCPSVHVWLYKKGEILADPAKAAQSR